MHTSGDVGIGSMWSFGTVRPRIQRNHFSCLSVLCRSTLQARSSATHTTRATQQGRLRSQIRSLDQAKRNANDGISLVQTAEGALNEVSSILVRLRELAIQSSNGSVSDQDKSTLDEEFQSLVSEVNRIGRSTEFSGIKLLDGSSSSVSFQVGFGTTQGIDTLSVSLSAALSTSLSLNSLGSLRGTLGAVQNRLGSTINNLAITSENLSAAESRIRDVDVAYETAQLTRNSILQQASISVLSQANALPQSALRLLG